MPKQRLEQKTKFNLNPQQIKFLSLLQIPITDLDNHIKKEIEENPVIEEEESEYVDSNSDFYYSKSNKNNQALGYQIEDKKTSLSDYLHSQLVDLNVPKKIYNLISYLINSLDKTGYLDRDLQSISNDLLINNNMKIDEEEINVALNCLKEMEPCGVGSHNLQECLITQLKKKHPKNIVALKVITDHYSSFTNKNFRLICEKLNISQKKLKAIYTVIETLQPVPSFGFDNNNSFNEYITADFKVTTKNNSLELSTTKTRTKGINVSSYYKNLLQNTKDTETKDFLKVKIEHALWFKNALVERELTLKKVVSAIINFQEKYFFSGSEEDLTPMTLKDIAKIVKLDISTISRVSNSKFIETFFGTFKIKELFSEAYRKDNGETVSNKAIKKHLYEIIENEDKNKPYTDEELCKILGENEYHIARRTVSKYRSSLKILNANKRKKL